ncbi:MAG: sodium:solute symporter family protein [Gammaproteobacteria bacterium]|nr:sodium:solute symporter family protein [Gammaproteobacteria bacterium]
MDLEQWTVGGRQFGLVLVWLLIAGEFYTTFTFLGACGWAYSKGAPVLYVVAYQPLGCVIGFFVLPRLWEVGRRHRLQTLADFFVVRFRSERLGALVALIGVAFLIPYLQLQLTGLGIIVEVASDHAVGRTPAMLIAFLLVAAFVSASGIRGVAWVSVLKDALMLVTVLVVGLTIPYLYFGGLAPMFTALERANPGHLVLPGSTRDLGHAWYITTVLLSAVGVPMWPHFFAANLSARSADTLRRNAMILPLYGITVPLVLFVGLAATLLLPRLGNGDLAMLALVRRTFPPWFLGVVGGAGALTAMVPAAILILSASTLFAKNLVRPMFAPQMSDAAVARLARRTVFLVTGIALLLAMHGSRTLVALLLLGYAGIAQFFPGVVLGLFWPPIRKSAVAAGLLVGIGLTAALMASGHDPWHGLNAGFAGLCANLLVTVGFSLRVPADRAGSRAA